MNKENIYLLSVREWRVDYKVRMALLFIDQTLEEREKPFYSPGVEPERWLVDTRLSRSIFKFLYWIPCTHKVYFYYLTGFMVRPRDVGPGSCWICYSHYNSDTKILTSVTHYNRGVSWHEPCVMVTIFFYFVTRINNVLNFNQGPCMRRGRRSPRARFV